MIATCWINVEPTSQMVVKSSQFWMKFQEWCNGAWRDRAMYITSTGEKQTCAVDMATRFVASVLYERSY